MRADDAANDRQSKPGAAGTPPVAAPEPLEDQLALLRRYPRAGIADDDAAVAVRGDLHGRGRSGVGDRVLHQVAHRLEQRAGIAFHPDWLLRAADRDIPPLRHGNRRHETGDIGADRPDIGDLAGLDRQAIEFGGLDQLVDDPGHARDVRQQLAGGLPVRQRLDFRAQDGQRRAQLMRRVGHEFLLHREAMLQPVQRLVDRAHQRQDVARHARLRQPDIGARRPDLLRQGGRFLQRMQRLAEDQQVDAQQRQQDRHDHPGHVRQELGHDVVDQHVAMRLVLRNLHPQRFGIDRHRHAGVEEARLPDVALAIAGLRAEVLFGEQGFVRLARRKQHAPASGQHGKAVTIIADRVEVAQVVRQIERPVSVRPAPQILRDLLRLLAQGALVQVARGAIHPPVQRQRQHDGGGDQGDDMHRDQPSLDRAEPDHGACADAR